MYACEARIIPKSSFGKLHRMYLGYNECGRSRDLKVCIAHRLEVQSREMNIHESTATLQMKKKNSSLFGQAPRGRRLLVARAVTALLPDDDDDVGASVAERSEMV